MALEPGSRLANYAIVELIGAGGMGEVYRARDEKLGRDVAIKILPEEFAGDQERLARFEREAKLLASVNHPGIATLHGLEESDGTQFLVMEMVEGETLAERIARGPIPIQEAIPLFIQIAEALEAAHERAVIHRDLKPANIKITPDDRIKILDFGLAKAWQDEAAGADSSQSPTLTKGTAMGAIMGTAAYMSPEQARGKPIDKRTDLWAFGVVVYETLTGKRAFKGDDVSETLAFVLTKDLDWDALPADTPSSLRRLLRRTLERDRHERLADAADARIELTDAAVSEDASHATQVTVATGWPKLLAAASLAAIVSGLAVWSSTRTESPPVARLMISPPPSEPILLDPRRSSLAITPDGSGFVYRTNVDGDLQLRLRPLDGTSTTVLTSSESLSLNSPFVSPDGNWIGFVHGNELKKVSIRGGTPICELPAGLGTGALRGASWGDDDSIVFAVFQGGGASGLFRVSARGGEPEALTEPEGLDHYWPEILPGSRAVLFTIRQGVDARNWKIGVRSLETEREEVPVLVLINGGTFPRYSPTGHIVYSLSGQLQAVPFDAVRLEVTGDPVTLPQSVMETGTGDANFALSNNGVLASVLATPGGTFENRLAWVDRQGEATHLPYRSEFHVDVALSPDGEQMALDLASTTGDAARDIWIYDVERGARTRLTLEGGAHPVWTPDGKQVAFAISSVGLFWRPVDGSREAESLLMDERVWMGNSWSPDGNLLAFTSRASETGADIWVLSLEEGPSPFLATPAREDGPMFSPDGRFLAYVSDESGIEEVYVQPYPGPGGKVAISIGGGRAPVWSPDGSEIFYRGLNQGQMMAVAVATDPTFEAGRPQTLFDELYPTMGSGDPHYDISRDGKRFLMIDESVVERGMPTQIMVTLNWFQELERLVPTK